MQHNLENYLDEITEPPAMQDARKNPDRFKVSLAGMHDYVNNKRGLPKGDLQPGI